jgi:hypothetical protein
MEYHFSSVKPHAHARTLAVFLFSLFLALACGVFYFFTPRTASILVDTAPFSLPAGEEKSLTVTVHNATNYAFNASDRFFLSGRYYAEGGTAVIAELPRVDIQGLRPGHDQAYRLPVAAGLPAGNYRLVVDLIKEGSSWFEDMGDRSYNIPVVVK